MPEDLLQSVNTTLLPAIQPLGFEVVDSRVFDSFDNALVVLCSSSLRIRIARERGQILVDFGPPTQHNLWFDSDIILEHLQLSTDRSFVGTSATNVLRGLGAFILAFSDDLRRMFDSTHLAGTTHEMDKLKERRAKRLFGWNPPAKGKT
ncbi:MAG TPA: hypothetical protein VF722_10505 [Gemmatimonadaceae bacterium]|jgi:hypothetical protein